MATIPVSAADATSARRQQDLRDHVWRRPAIRKIGLHDLRVALARGVDDFWSMPSHLIFLALIYPVAGVILAQLTFSFDVVPLLFPLMAGFALVGPFAAVGLYELSRRRERGLSVSWRAAFATLRGPPAASLLGLGLVLLFIFAAWMLTAQALYVALFGPEPPQSFAVFLRQILTTEAGWTLIGVGGALGFVYAAVVLSISVVSFPLILDRGASVAEAVATSMRAVVKNPVPMAAWGLIVALGLIAGFLLLFAGLAIVVPVLGHATWALYRRVVADEE